MPLLPLPLLPLPLLLPLLPLLENVKRVLTNVRPLVSVCCSSLSSNFPLLFGDEDTRGVALR